MNEIKEIQDALQASRVFDTPLERRRSDEFKENAVERLKASFGHLTEIHHQVETTVAMLDNLIADVRAGRPIKPSAVEGLIMRRDGLGKLIGR